MLFRDGDDFGRGTYHDWYDVAQVCLNGHLVNAKTKDSPQHNKDFCTKCGNETITKCPECNQDIPGDYHVEGSNRAEYFSTALLLCKLR